MNARLTHCFVISEKQHWRPRWKGSLKLQAILQSAAGKVTWHLTWIVVAESQHATCDLRDTYTLPPSHLEAVIANISVEYNQKCITSTLSAATCTALGIAFFLKMLASSWSCHGQSGLYKLGRLSVLASQSACWCRVAKQSAIDSGYPYCTWTAVCEKFQEYYFSSSSHIQEKHKNKLSWITLWQLRCLLSVFFAVVLCLSLMSPVACWLPATTIHARCHVTFPAADCSITCKMRLPFQRGCQCCFSMMQQLTWVVQKPSFS